VRNLSRAFAFAALLAASASAWADPQDTIDYRRHVMKTMGEQVAAIRMILEKKAPADNLAVHVAVIAATAPQAKKAFEPQVPGGNAKPAVWADWADFSKRLDSLVAATDELAKAAKGSAAAVTGAKLQALPCQGCHETYRVPPKAPPK
jgi:cytochrome c556